jgi:hypothetical protein
MSTYTEPVLIVRSQIERLDTLCHGIVTRDGWEDACSKPATTVLYDAEGGDVWPACTWHANRNGGALTLAQIREALTTGATELEREVVDY